MLKTELIVKAVGSPDFKNLSDFERTSFFETLFDRIQLSVSSTLSPESESSGKPENAF